MKDNNPLNPEVFLADKDRRKALFEAGKAAQNGQPELSGIFPQAPQATALPPEHSDQIAAHILWWGDKPLLPGRPYMLSAGNQETICSISELKYRLEFGGCEHSAAKNLNAGETAFCNLSLQQPITFQPFQENPQAGTFVLKNKTTGQTAGLGIIDFGLRRATNLRWQQLDLDQHARARLMQQKPFVLWFTGLSGSGKSTIASLLEKRLHEQGRFTYLLDGDNVRHGLCRDLGFTDADRVENLRRVAETAKLFTEAGLIVMLSFISPFRAERRMARELFKESEFLEVHVDTPLEICEARDEKGLYAKARAGKIKNFTGIDSAYEAPENADIHLESGHVPPDELVTQIIQDIKSRSLI